MSPYPFPTTITTGTTFMQYIYIYIYIYIYKGSLNAISAVAYFLPMRYMHCNTDGRNVLTAKGQSY